MLAAASGLLSGEQIDAARAGQRLFQLGYGRAAAELTARVGGSATLSGSLVACARCHGLDGAGAREAGVAAPALRWAALTRERAAGGGLPARPAYDEASLMRALRDGVDPAGRPLAGAMPRFALSPREAADLLQYLRRVGTEDDFIAGVAPERIVLGTVLPRRGAAAPLAQAVESGVRACLARANRDGGVYGRQLELQVFEAAEAAAGNSTTPAPWTSEVLMLVAPWWPQGTAAMQSLVLGPLPVLGPLGVAAELEDASRWWFGVSPQLGDQARVLVDQAVAASKVPQGSAAASPPGGRPQPRRLLLLAGSDALSQTGARAARSQAGMHEGVELQTWTVAPGMPLAQRLAQQLSTAAAQPDAVLALLPPEALTAAAVAMEQAPRRVWLWSSALLAGDAPAAWTPAQRERLRLATTAPLPAERDTAQFEADLQALGERPRATAVQAWAWASACAAVEALRRAGRQPHREAVVTALESLRGWRTGVTQPLTYGPRQRHGQWESRIVRLAADGRTLEAETPWLAPLQP